MDRRQRYAVALHSGGRADEAMTLLKQGLASHPSNRDILSALVAFNREAGNADAALEYAEQLARLAPDDPRLSALVRELRRQAQKPSAN